VGSCPAFAKKGALDSAASDKVYQLLAHGHGRWFSPGTPPSSTTKAGHHDIAESGIKTQKIKSIKSLLNIVLYFYF
jgi:hypothetical protein